MRFALVFNPFKYKVHEENIRVVQRYFGLFPPLSLTWPAAIAEKAGHEVILVDARTLNLSKAQTLSVLKDFNPDIMGFMMTTYMFRDTLEWIKFLKDRLDIPVVVGGYNLRVYPEESLSHQEIDFGVKEHSYYTIPALFRELQRDVPDFDNVPGLVYRRAGKVIVTPHPQRINFEDFPFPARHLLPNELYAEFPAERRNFTVMVTSLGCPHNCEFCEAGRTVYNPRSPEKVVQEMEECYHKYNVREIDIFDYEFTGIRDRVLKICRLIQSKKLDVIWACRSRIDSVDEELLIEMKKSGCSRIYFGLESGSQEILDNVNKGITIEQTKTIIALCNKLGIKALGFFLIGAPGETRYTLDKTLTFAKSLNLDYVQFSKCLAKPQTPLHSQMVKNTGKDYWKEWVLGKEIDQPLDRPWTELSNEEIDRFARKAYISFYSRPRFIWRHLRRIKSLSELIRKFFALFDMVFSQEERSKSDEKFTAFNENRFISKYRSYFSKAKSKRNFSKQGE